MDFIHSISGDKHSLRPSCCFGLERVCVCVLLLPSPRALVHQVPSLLSSYVPDINIFFSWVLVDSNLDLCYTCKLELMLSVIQLCAHLKSSTVRIGTLADTQYVVTPTLLLMIFIVQVLSRSFSSNASVTLVE